jgi:hypothetical protein
MIHPLENVARAIFSPKTLVSVAPGIEQDFMILAIQRELVEIAQKGLYRV